MVRKRKVGRPAGRAKDKLLSVRISTRMQSLLAAAAWKNKRSLSREVEARLDDTLGRYQKGRAALPLRVKRLLDAIAFAVRVIEHATERTWQDRYVSGHLVRMIGCIIAEYALPGKSTIPPKVLEEAKRHIAGDAYPTRLGEELADGVIAWFRFTPEPQEGYPEWYSEFWKIERDLRPKA